MSVDMSHGNRGIVRVSMRSVVGSVPSGCFYHTSPRYWNSNWYSYIPRRSHSNANA